MQYFVAEHGSLMHLLAEPEEDRVKFFILEELKEGELFLGKIPYNELKKFAPGMVDIDPDILASTTVPLIDD